MRFRTIHASMIVRPRRTSQREAPRAITFSSSALRCGYYRARAEGHDARSADDQRTVLLGVEGMSGWIRKHRIYPERAGHFLKAIELARRDVKGRHRAGSWTSPTGAVFDVWALVGRGERTVYLGRSGADGKFLGQPIPFEDLDGLAEAMTWLAQAATN